MIIGKYGDIDNNSKNSSKSKKTKKDVSHSQANSTCSQDEKDIEDMETDSMQFEISWKDNKEPRTIGNSAKKSKKETAMEFLIVPQGGIRKKLIISKDKKKKKVQSKENKKDRTDSSHSKKKKNKKGHWDGLKWEDVSPLFQKTITKKILLNLAKICNFPLHEEMDFLHKKEITAGLSSWFMSSKCSLTPDNFVDFLAQAKKATKIQKDEEANKKRDTETAKRQAYIIAEDSKRTSRIVQYFERRCSSFTDSRFRAFTLFFNNNEPLEKLERVSTSSTKTIMDMQDMEKNVRRHMAVTKHPSFAVIQISQISPEENRPFSVLDFTLHAIENQCPQFKAVHGAREGQPLFVTLTIPNDIKKLLLQRRIASVIRRDANCDDEEEEEEIENESRGEEQEKRRDSFRLYISLTSDADPPAREPIIPRGSSGSRCADWERDVAFKFHYDDDDRLEYLFQFEHRNRYVRLSPPLSDASPCDRVTFAFPAKQLYTMFKDQVFSSFPPSLSLYVGLEKAHEQECAVLHRVPEISKDRKKELNITDKSSKNVQISNVDIEEQQEREFYEQVKKVFAVLNLDDKNLSATALSSMNRDTMWIDISLVDRHTLTRLRYPGRGIRCEHLNVFDLSEFILSNESRLMLVGSWRCRLCNEVATADELVRNLFIEKLVKSAPNLECKIFRVHNPRFRTKSNPGGASDMELDGGGDVSSYYTEYL